MSSSSSRRNILPHINNSYLKRCHFNRSTDPDCPIFRLKDIVSEAGEEFQDIAVKVQFLSPCQSSPRSLIGDLSVCLSWLKHKCFCMCMKGGILGIIIDWSCDLDWWKGKCYPTYSFRRLDNKNPVNNVAPGYNFR